MPPDWNQVKKLTLWSYEELIKKLQDNLAVPFVQEHYNHTMDQALVYAKRVRENYLRNRGEMTGSIDCIASSFSELHKRSPGTYSSLVDQLQTRQQCKAFLHETDLEFEALVQVLNYLLRWVLPFRASLREFIDVEDGQETSHLEVLKTHKIRSNLDLLETGRTKPGRAALVTTTSIPVADVITLVHRVDISRLAYVRGKTVMHLCGGGYDTLERLANADLAEMEMKMDAYYRTLGKSLADYKAVIPLAWMVGGARILPRVVIE